MNSSKYLFLLVAIIAFSTYEVTSKLFLGVNSFQLTFIRFFIGGLVMLPFSIIQLRKKEYKFCGKDLLKLLGLGVLLVVISMNLMQAGLNSTPASLAAVIFSANPIFVALFSGIINKEHPSLGKIVGMLIGLFGVFIAFLPSLATQREHKNITVGVIMILMATISFGLYTVLGKNTSIKMGSVSQTSISFLLGSVCMLPFMAVIRSNPIAVPWVANIWQFAYMTLIVTGVAYMCYFSALEKLDTGLGSMTFFVKPILASVISWVFLRENISSTLIISIVVILLGIILVKRSVGGDK